MRPYPIDSGVVDLDGVLAVRRGRQELVRSVEWYIEVLTAAGWFIAVSVDDEADTAYHRFVDAWTAPGPRSVLLSDQVDRDIADAWLDRFNAGIGMYRPTPGKADE
jgi:hypothetical protein